LSLLNTTTFKVFPTPRSQTSSMQFTAHVLENYGCLGHDANWSVK